MQVQDEISYFLHQFDYDDLLLVTDEPDCHFREYEMKKAETLRNRIESFKIQTKETIASFVDRKKQNVKDFKVDLMKCKTA